MANIIARLYYIPTKQHRIQNGCSEESRKPVIWGEEGIQKVSSNSHSRSVSEMLFVSFLAIQGT